MILYNNNDQQITLPGIRVGASLIAGAQLTATLVNTLTNQQVFSVQMQDSVGNPGNYIAQPPLFTQTPGKNYRMTYSGVVQTYEFTLIQDVEIQDRTH